MGLVTSILDAIVAIPKILDQVKAGITWVVGQIQDAEGRKAQRDLARAIEQAKLTHDTSGMDNGFHPDGNK